LNELPQFRTAIKLKDALVPLRIHFLHIKSPHPNAVPLLLIPSFPLTNFSLVPLFKPLTEDPARPFHLVVPSIPGLGFSDALSGEGVLEGTAECFDVLMRRLGYAYYLASATGSGVVSLGGVDYHIARLVGERFGESCLGVHLIGPPLERPKWRSEPLAWGKFNLAKFFHASVWGYEEDDWKRLRDREAVGNEGKRKGTGYGVVGMVGLREPNTLAYALCDSPVGLLSLICSVLRKRNPQHALNSEEVIDVTQLCWLPGPEAAMRFWASAVMEAETLKKEKRARVGITVFGDEGEGYTCPEWGAGQHEIVCAQRVGGKSGLLVFERPDVVVAGIQALAKEVEKRDKRLKVKVLEEVVVGRIEAPVLGMNEQTGMSEHGIQLDVESPATVVAVEP